MNERIDQLIQQCTTQQFSDCVGGYETFDKEMFAELIVKECAEICDQQGRVGWNDDRKAQARLDRDLIKEHFGVEE